VVEPLEVEVLEVLAQRVVEMLRVVERHLRLLDPLPESLAAFVVVDRGARSDPVQLEERESL